MKRQKEISLTVQAFLALQEDAFDRGFLTSNRDLVRHRDQWDAEKKALEVQVDSLEKSADAARARIATLEEANFHANETIHRLRVEEMRKQ